MKARSAKSSRPAKKAGATRRRKAARGGPVAKVMRPTDVCAEFGIQPYVLKFWENEFPQLGRRLGSKREYGPRERKLVAAIYALVEEERLTLADARLALDRTFPLPSGQKATQVARQAVKRTDAAAGAADASAARVRELEARLTRVEAERDRLRIELKQRGRRPAPRAEEPAARTTRPDPRLLEELDACLDDAREVSELSEVLLMALAPGGSRVAKEKTAAARAPGEGRRGRAEQAGLFTSKK